MIARWMLIAGLLVLTGPRSRAQDPGQEATFTLRGGQTMEIQELLVAYGEVTGKRIITSPRRKHEGPLVRLSPDRTAVFPRARAEDVFQSILVTNGYAVVPLGDPSLRLCYVTEVRNSHTLKTLARPVTPGELDDAARRPAEVVTCAIRLRHATAGHVRQAMQHIIQHRTAEYIQEVTSSNTLLVTGFGPMVHQVATLVRSLDVLPPEREEEPVEEGQGGEEGERDDKDGGRL